MSAIDYKAITVATGDGSCELELVPEFGGLSNRLSLSTTTGKIVDLIAGLNNRGELQSDPIFRGAFLFPFPSRLENGRYHYGGKDYQFSLNEKALKNALHGFLYELEPELLALEKTELEASASLLYRYDGSIEAYPFPVEVLMEYKLSQKEGLAIKVEVTNLHNETIPVGVGWHPYFHLGQQVDDLRLQLPSVKRIGLDERLLPTGQQFDYDDFTSLTLIGERKLDNCFQLDLDKSLNKSLEKARTILWSDDAGLGLELWQEVGAKGRNYNACNYVQVYIPDDRQSIAIEPVSCGINAFNTDEGLVHLEAGQTHSVQYGVRLIEQIV